VAVKSKLLDRGSSVIEVYPEVEVINARGERVRVPSTTAVKVRVSMSKDRNASAELPGQVDVKIIRCVTRKAPVGSWAKVVYAGEEWDLAAPPHFDEGVSKATRNVTFTLRSRNDLGAHD
jgi:hypothetical protein